MLPQSIQTRIKNELNTAVKTQKGIYGGDINEAAKVELEDGRTFFVKWNNDAPRGMFEAEAEGLKLLKGAGTNIKVPGVKVIAENFLVLDWIEEGGGREHSAYEFGQELAKVHQNSDEQFGLNHDNFIGKLPQSNTRHSNWPDFFAIERIEPQVKMGVESGKLTRSILRTVEKMYTKLGSIFPTEKPALIHGDLWSGNYMFTKSGNASIYDPAVYYGHREMEVAMTRLFGGFSANFYEGYNEVYPLDSGFDDRVTLCNLYPILVHANLFGGSYCRQAENIINSYG